MRAQKKEEKKIRLPRPSSISSSFRVNDGPSPGTLHGDKHRPIVPVQEIIDLKPGTQAYNDRQLTVENDVTYPLMQSQWSGHEQFLAMIFHLQQEHQQSSNDKPTTVSWSNLQIIFRESNESVDEKRAKPQAGQGESLTTQVLFMN